MTVDEILRRVPAVYVGEAFANDKHRVPHRVLLDDDAERRGKVEAHREHQLGDKLVRALRKDLELFHVRRVVDVLHDFASQRATKPVEHRALGKEACLFL